MVVSDRVPSTKATQARTVRTSRRGSTSAPATVIVLSAIDNLVKGTAGQAIQCLNLMAGLGETTGLPVVGLTP